MRLGEFRELTKDLDDDSLIEIKCTDFFKGNIETYYKSPSVEILPMSICTKILLGDF